MAVLRSEIDPTSRAVRANADAMRALVEDLRSQDYGPMTVGVADTASTKS